MLRILCALCFLVVTNSIAQEKGKPSDNKKAALPVDYTHPGAPMPPLALVVFHDTALTHDTTLNNLSKKQRKAVSKQMSKQVITGDDLTSKANVFVMLFNPECSHCDDETALLMQNAGLFKKSPLVLVANKNMLAYLPNFERRQKIELHPSMYIGRDSSGFIDNLFLYQALPQINIYSPAHKLLKTYAGDTPLDSLKKYIQ